MRRLHVRQLMFSERYGLGCWTLIHNRRAYVLDLDVRHFARILSKGLYRKWNATKSVHVWSSPHGPVKRMSVVRYFAQIAWQTIWPKWNALLFIVILVAAFWYPKTFTIGALDRTVNITLASQETLFHVRRLAAYDCYYFGPVRIRLWRYGLTGGGR